MAYFSMLIDTLMISPLHAADSCFQTPPPLRRYFVAIISPPPLAPPPPITLRCYAFSGFSR
jgi:hypothetical protein